MENLLPNGLRKCDQEYCRREGIIKLSFVIVGEVMLCKQHAAEWLNEKHSVGRQLSNGSVFAEQPEAPKTPRYRPVNDGRMSDQYMA